MALATAVAGDLECSLAVVARRALCFRRCRHLGGRSERADVAAATGQGLRSARIGAVAIVVEGRRYRPWIRLSSVVDRS